MFGQLFKRTVRRQVRRKGSRFITYSMMTIALPIIIMATANFIEDVTLPNWFPWQEQVEFQQAIVTRVIDGDTIVIMYNNTEDRVRLIGINTPEIGEAGADEATEFATLQISNADWSVWLEVGGNDRDRFDRLRRYVWLTDPTDDHVRTNPDHYLLNRMLVNEGHAVIWD